ncbi:MULTISPECIES: prepilin-type N-terminal cleavage/methylation domain-containing protein [Idiomarina]|jgi:MSHA pilin protein MshC|uniref:prepilin-type N-terminal cleavage/methylation domain-containing protein n=1 Tax=Idiomarina TaxID=135575 RepID=UPI000C466703|nr:MULTISPECIES: prepilin-type N-terminal cleavage/methylation domain-containing protein [Idiomarina]MBE92897.1 Type II secretory pathway component [Idiomarina sp.]MBH94218.1 Type II secretory pathway component [Idiomarina sp.]|tara:strand:+ start:524 stop:949 length:426 start_codon:yes stop_codon:yes gene_type:complete
MKSRGFTLIELIIILVIIGILAVSASPLFISDSGTKSQTARLQAMGILRAVQQQAMQDTVNDYSISVTESTLGNPPYSEDNSLQLSNLDDITFSPSGLTIGFNALGQPTQGCTGGCTITITENLGVIRTISINKEGFIDAQ